MKGERLRLRAGRRLGPGPAGPGRGGGVRATRSSGFRPRGSRGLAGCDRARQADSPSAGRGTARGRATSRSARTRDRVGPEADPETLSGYGGNRRAAAHGVASRDQRRVARRYCRALGRCERRCRRERGCRAPDRACGVRRAQRQAGIADGRILARLRRHIPAFRGPGEPARRRRGERRRAVIADARLVRRRIDGSDIAMHKTSGNWHVVMRKAWGDCPSGCIHEETHFSPSVAGTSNEQT